MTTEYNINQILKDYQSEIFPEDNSQLKVIQYQVKEKKGICTCEKKVPCRGTCIPR